MASITVPGSLGGGGGELAVGRQLAKLRRRAGLTGKQLADRVGTTQSRISRIETGAVLPDPAAVGRIAEVLGVPAEMVARLVDEADVEKNRLRQWRPERTGLVGKQVEIGDHEQRSKVVRLFQPSMIAGLLQTDIYAKTIMAAAQRPSSRWSQPVPESDLLEAVAGRLRRREMLLDSRKDVMVLLFEAALASRMVNDEEMLRQVELVQNLAAGGRFQIRVHPFEAPVPFPVIHGFELLDDRVLIIDLLDVSMTSTGREITRHYRQIFDEMWEATSPDAEPILARYAALYRGSGG